MTPVELELALDVAILDIIEAVLEEVECIIMSKGEPFIFWSASWTVTQSWKVSLALILQQGGD